MSHGRDAAGGWSLKPVDSAREAQNPAMPSSHTAASAPPATITSASPHMISRAASPIACTPVAQAVTTEWFGPLKPYLIDTWPDARLISAEGMKNGDSRRARPSCTRIDASKIVSSPPMPEPIITPVAQRSSSVSGVQPESSTASVAATMAEMDEAVHLLLVLDRDPLGDVEAAARP